MAGAVWPPSHGEPEPDAVAEVCAANAHALEGDREHRRQDLRIAKLKRRLSMDSDDSDTPTSQENIVAKTAARPGRSPSRSAARTASSEGTPAATRARA